MIHANEVRVNIAIAERIAEEKRIIEDIRLHNEIVENTIKFCETTVNNYLQKTTEMPIVLPWEIMESIYYLHTRYNHHYFYRVSWSHYKTKNGEKRDVDHIGGEYLDYNTLTNYLAKYGFSVSLDNCSNDFNRSCACNNVYRIKIGFTE